MYGILQEVVLRIFQVSAEPPHVPPGGHGAATVFRASPAFWRCRMLGFLVSTLFLGAIATAVAAVFVYQGVAHGVSTLGIVGACAMGLGWLAVTVTHYVVVRLDYELRWYVITDRSLRIRQGIVTFEETTLTFANVQNTSIQQGPLERWFGIANVVVETAGGGASSPGEGAAARVSHRGLIRGLDDAAAVRDLIRAAVVRRGGAGLGDRDDSKHAPAVTTSLAAAVPHLEAVLGEVRLLREALERRAAGRAPSVS